MKTEADKIARKLIKEYALDDDFACLDDYRYLFKKAMEEYHQSKLQALKEEVEKLREHVHTIYPDGPTKECLVKDEVLNLITNLED